jgi:hypothetical protein
MLAWCAASSTTGPPLDPWLTAIPVGVFAMYAVDDFRMFLIAWAAAGLAAVVLVDVKARNRS